MASRRPDGPDRYGRSFTTNVDVPTADATLDLDTSSTPTTKQEFERYHGVVGDFLPFAYRDYDPIDVMGDVRAAIEEFPETKRSFRMQRLAEKMSDDYTAQAINGIVPDSMLYCLGTWPVEDTTSTNVTRWVNPSYVHRHAVPTQRCSEPGMAVNGRREWLDTCAFYGVLDNKHAATSLGITYQSLETWCSRQDYPWREKRTRGKHRMARTWRTANQWGVAYSTIAEAFAMPLGTVKSWTHYYATDAGFSAPPDPSGTDAFTK